MTEIEKKFIACLKKQKVTSFKMSLCQHSETSLFFRVRLRISQEYMLWLLQEVDLP